MSVIKQSEIAISKMVKLLFLLVMQCNICNVEVFLYHPIADAWKIKRIAPKFYCFVSEVNTGVQHH